MYYSFLIKKKNIYFFLNLYYFYLFNILNSNIILKINTIIDIVATHYPNNLNNEFELLYVNLNYNIKFTFFFKNINKKRKFNNFYK